MGTAVVPERDRLAPLDGLRGIAIALVVWYHLWQITWLFADVHVGPWTLDLNAIPETGFVGVDLFFFISGFVLFAPYARALFDGRPTPSVRTFAANRAVKIVPSYYLSIAVVVALGWANFSSPGDAFAQLATHAFFVHVWSDDTYGGINGVLWSLAVEVQFYVLFPLVAWCAMRRALPTFAALALLGLGYRLAVARHADAVHDIMQLPGTIDLFAAGMATAYAYRAVATRAPTLAARRRLWTCVALAGIVASACAVRGAYDARVLPNWPTAWYVFGRSELAASFACATLGTLFAHPLWQRAIANPALTFLGFVSYNAYLYHQVVARALLAAHVPPWRGTSEHADPTWGLAFTCVAASVSLAIAWVLTTFVERPLIGALARARSRRGSLKAALTPERV